MLRNRWELSVFFISKLSPCCCNFKNGKKIGSWDGYPSSESGKNYLAIEATKLAKKHGVNPRGLMTVDAENEKRKGKLVPNKDFGFPVNRKESVEEAKAPGATAQHGVDANTQDTFEKQLSTRKGEKDFVDQHSMEVGMDIEKITAENKKSIEDALKDSDRSEAEEYMGKFGIS